MISTLSQAGIGVLVIVFGVAAVVFTYRNRRGTDPEWYKSTKSHVDEVREETRDFEGYFGGGAFILLGLLAVLDAIGFYDINW